MSYQHNWYIAERVAYFSYHGDVSAEDLQRSNQVLQNILDEADTVIHAIFDVRELTGYPKNIREMKNIARSFGHENMGWMIVVEAGPLESFFVNVISGVFGIQSKTVSSIDEAEQILKRVDPVLFDDK